VLSPGALVAYARTGSVHGGAPGTGIPGLPGAVGLPEISGQLPGDPVAGVDVFRVFCAGCHNMKAAGMQGDRKPGSDMDERRPTFAKIVTLIVQGGGGGAPSKQLLEQLTFQQIYDVAAFISVYAGKPGPVRGAKLKPPSPVALAAPLRTAGAEPAGHFTATLAGRALRWHLAIRGVTPKDTPAGLIRFARATLRPIKLVCSPCNDPGHGFAVVTPAQAAALAKGGGVVLVQSSVLPNGAVRGQLSAPH
jgi:mono/diheme cytochrome c family protein